MVNVLVPHKNVKCRFSDYLLLESVWTGAVFHQPSVTADSPDLWLYTRAASPLHRLQSGSCRGAGMRLLLPCMRARMTAQTQPVF